MNTGRIKITEEMLRENQARYAAEQRVLRFEETLISSRKLCDEDLKHEIKIAFQRKGEAKLARYLTTLFILRKFKIITDFRTDTIKAYDPEQKYFKDIGAEIIKKFVTDELNLNNTRSTSEEILHLLRTQTYIDDERLKQAAPLNLIPFKNCILNLDTDKTFEHKPEFLFDFQIPIIYDPQAKCPEIEKFFSEIVSPENIPLLYDIVGLTLYRINYLEKFFVLTGQGSNGKSKYLSLLEHFIGEENCSSITLKQLSEDKFSVARTYKKLLNVGADIGQTTIMDTSILKSACSTDRISGQFKFGQIFDFLPSATLIYSANNPPNFADDSAGMYRRAELILFPNLFGNEKDILENPDCKKADPKILEKLTTPLELSGLANKAIIHLKNIIKTGQLSIVKSTAQLRTSYLKHSNSVQAFMEECCEEAEYIPPDYNGENKTDIPAEGFLWISDLYPKYCQYCERHKLSKKSKDAFSKGIRKLTDWNLELGLKDWKNSKDDKQRSVRGIALKEEYQDG